MYIPQTRTDTYILVPYVHSKIIVPRLREIIDISMHIYITYIFHIKDKHFIPISTKPILFIIAPKD